jgi:hypothetical protein
VTPIEELEALRKQQLEDPNYPAWEAFLRETAKKAIQETDEKIIETAKKAIQETDEKIIPQWTEIVIVSRAALEDAQESGDFESASLGAANFCALLRQALDYQIARTKQWEERCHDLAK